MPGPDHAGTYLGCVRGETASVEVARSTGPVIGGGHVTDSVFLPDIHPDVTAAIVGRAQKATLGEEALGIVETSSVASVIDGADAGVKAAHVVLGAVGLADGLGGKGYVFFSGTVSDVEAAVEAAVSRVESHGTLIRSDVIAQLHHELIENPGAQLRFLKRVERRCHAVGPGPGKCGGVGEG